MTQRFLLIFVLCGVFAGSSSAQQEVPQTAGESPASKEDIERYLEVMHSRDMMMKMVDAMSKPMHQMIHEQFAKDRDQLPADFEARMTKEIDDYLKNLPFEEMLQAMIPAYQKHLSKNDVDALVTFYSGPTGQKLIKEMPVMTAEAMQSMMPLLEKHIQAMTERVQQDITEMIQESRQAKKKTPPPTSN
jgi:uncharacterized protein